MDEQAAKQAERQAEKEYSELRENLKRQIVETLAGLEIDVSTEIAVDREKGLPEHWLNNPEYIEKKKDEKYRRQVQEIVYRYLQYRGLDYSLQQKKNIIEELINITRGLGILQPILEDKTVTEVMVNGTAPILVERAGRIVELDIRFDNSKELERIIRKIVESVNREINQSSPIVDARLADGSRVNAVFPPVALNGPILTIRKFPDKPLMVEDLIRWGSITEEVAEILKVLVAARYNIFVSGGTGSGKTTFLNMLSNFIPKDERIITIEDAAELRINGITNLVRLEARKSANREAGLDIPIRELIKASLRMRPDRVVVGEVRGEEALDMLQAMNTGHDGSLSTGHANSVHDMMSRLETMVLMGVELPLEAIRQQIASALDIVIHLGRLRDKSRKTLEICEVLGYNVQTKQIELNPLFRFEEEPSEDKKKVKGRLQRTGNKLQSRLKLQMAGYELDI